MQKKIKVHAVVFVSYYLVVIFLYFSFFFNNLLSWWVSSVAVSLALWRFPASRRKEKMILETATHFIANRSNCLFVSILTLTLNFSRSSQARLHANFSTVGLVKVSFVFFIFFFFLVPKCVPASCCHPKDNLTPYPNEVGIHSHVIQIQMFPVTPQPLPQHLDKLRVAEIHSLSVNAPLMNKLSFNWLVCFLYHKACA